MRKLSFKKQPLVQGFHMRNGLDKTLSKILKRFGRLTASLEKARKCIYWRTSRACPTGLTVSMLFSILLIIVTTSFIGCNDYTASDQNQTSVSPSINYKGKFKKGYVRKDVSTDKNASKNRARSRYYYQTKGKYRRKSKR
jgi:hypothetical protein